MKDPGGRPVEGLYLSHMIDDRTSSTLHAEHPEAGLYVTNQLEAGTWTVLLSRRDLKPARVRVKIEEGQTTEDQEYSLETVACIGCCGLSPCISVNDEVSAKLTPKKVRKQFRAPKKSAAK